MLFLEKITLDTIVLIDSGRVDQNGEVTFGVYTPDFEFLLLSDKTDKKILMLAEENQEITLFTTSGKFGYDYNIKGSGGSALLLELEKKRTNTLATLDSLAQEWLKIKYDQEHLAKKALFDSISDEVIRKHKDWVYSFINRYPESPATIIAVYQVLRPGMKLFDLENNFPLFQSIAETLGRLYPENIHVIDFCRRTDDFRKEKEAFEEREKLLQPGMPAPHFSLVSTSGDKVSLSSLEGKYVLIYFWDARRQDCWEINRQLAELYNNYRYRGFEILGIYYGDDKQLFFNTIRIDDLEWVHLFGNSMVEQQFNLRNNPMMILVDREGKIMQREIKPDELKNRIKWLFPPFGQGASSDTVEDTSS